MPIPHALPACGEHLCVWPPDERVQIRAPSERPRHATPPSSGGKLGHLEQISSVLAQQQVFVQRLAEQQEALQGLVEQQHEALCAKLDEGFLELRGKFPQAAAAPFVLDLGLDIPNDLPSDAHPSEAECYHEATHHKLHLFSSMKKSGTPDHQGSKILVETSADIVEEDVVGRSSTQKHMQLLLHRARKRIFMLTAYLDLAMGVIITLNLITLFAEVQWQSLPAAYMLGLRGDTGDWEVAENVFDVLEKVFNSVYLLEMLARIAMMKGNFFRDWFNVCDAIIVLVCCVDSFVLSSLPRVRGPGNSLALARILRILRAVRVVRFMKMLKFMNMFSALRVLVRTLTMSGDALLWSMMLIGFCIVSAAILMTQLTTGFIEDADQDYELRLWVFNHYGSAAKACLSMFEATFTAKWTILSRPLIDEVHPAFAVFWVFYTVCINFAVMRVVAALFLKQTMAVASIDAERMAIEKMKEQEKIVDMLRKIFLLADKAGDGVLHKWEFDEMMENEEVLDTFEKLGMEPNEVSTLYTLLSEDDGVADYEEFLSGAMKLKNQARTVDMIQVLHEQTRVRRATDKIKEGLERIDRALHPRDPWRADGEARATVPGG